MGGSIYYTEDKKGGLKRNVSKGDLDFEKQEIMSCWVVTPAARPAQERVVARSKKRKVERRRMRKWAPRRGSRRRSDEE